MKLPEWTKDESVRFAALYPKIAQTFFAAWQATERGDTFNLPSFGLAAFFGLNQAEYNDAKRQYPEILGQLEWLQTKPPGGVKRSRHEPPRRRRTGPLPGIVNPGPGSMGFFPGRPM